MSRPGNRPSFPWRRGLSVAGVCVALFGVGVVSRPSRSTGDYNGDGLVTTEDAFDFALAYRLRGEEGPAAPDADLNGDGEVNEMDVFRFLRHWNRDREESLERGVP